MATKRAQSFAESRLERLALNNEELAEKLASLKPFIETDGLPGAEWADVTSTACT